MAHELYTLANGNASMAFVGATPWHGLGSQLTPGADIDTWIRESGLDYEILESPVQFVDQHGVTRQWDKRKVMYRSDTGKPLGAASDRFQIVQPRQTVEFFREFQADNSMPIETAGSLYDGARYWALARIPDAGFTLAGGDVVKGYMMLATSCDGTLATQAKVTSVRVVCNNTLELADHRKSAHCVRVKHSTKFDETKVKVDMGLLSKEWDTFGAIATQLSKTRVSMRDAAQVLIHALGDPEKPVEEQAGLRQMAAILKLYETDAIGADMPSCNSTAWGLMNAATEYYDHHAGRSDNTRLASAWFGAAATSKESIFSTLLSLESKPASILLDTNADFAALLAR